MGRHRHTARHGRRTIGGGSDLAAAVAAAICSADHGQTTTQNGETLSKPAAVGRLWAHRGTASIAVVAIVAAGIAVPVVLPQPTPGTRSILAIARADCPPDCGGGPGGGSDGPPGGGSGFQPPSMPSPPPPYDPGRGYPQPDQNNGISIYNSAAPQRPATAPQQGNEAGQSTTWQTDAQGNQNMPNYSAPPNQQPSNSFLAEQQRLSQSPDDATNAAADLQEQQSNPPANNQPSPQKNDPSKTGCATNPGATTLNLDELQDLDVPDDLVRTYNDGLTPPQGTLRGLSGDPGGDPSAPMRMTIDGTNVAGSDDYGTHVAQVPPRYLEPGTKNGPVAPTDDSQRIITVSTIPNSGGANSGYAIGQITTGENWTFLDHGSSVFQDPGTGLMSEVAALPAELEATTAYMDGNSLDIVATNISNHQKGLWQVPLTDLLAGKFTSPNLLSPSYFRGAFPAGGLGQATLTRGKLPDGTDAWVLYETNDVASRSTMTTRIATGDVTNLLSSPRNPISFPGGDPGGRYYGADQIPAPTPDDPSRLMLITSRAVPGTDDYGVARGLGHFACPAAG